MTTDPQSPIPSSMLHNARSRPEQSPSGVTREGFLTIEYAGRPEHTPDVQGVLVRVDAENVTMTLEDGERLIFDATELRAVVA